MCPTDRDIGQPGGSGPLLCFFDGRLWWEAQGLTGWVKSGTYKRHLIFFFFFGLVWFFAGTAPHPH